MLAQRLTDKELPWEPLRGGETVVRRRVMVGEIPGDLLEMRGRDEVRYYQLQWKAAGRSLALASTYNPDDLLLMAESLRHRGSSGRGFWSSGFYPMSSGVSYKLSSAAILTCTPFATIMEKDT